MRYIFVFFCLSAFLITGCAVENKTNESKLGEPSWEKELLIDFRTDATDRQKEQFYDVNKLEFLSQFSNDSVKCRITTGESVDDFIERLSSDPLVTKIERFDPDKVNE